MEATMRSSLVHLVETLVAASRTTGARLPAQGNTGIRTAAWARSLSTKSSAPVTSPWHHRMGSATAQTLRQASRPQARGFTKPTSPLRTSPRRSFHSSRSRRSTGDSAKDSTHDIPEAKLSLSQRLKKLSREYGWSAVGVYLTLSVLDFPFCFLLVRTVGTDRIAVAEEYIVSHVEKLIPDSVKTRWHDYKQALKDGGKETIGNEAMDNVEMAGWGVKEADERNKSEASLATQLALAYAIHKSFIFIRVPLTAAVTPKVVKVLRGWGWQIGKKQVRKG